MGLQVKYFRIYVVLAALAGSVLVSSSSTPGNQSRMVGQVQPEQVAASVESELVRQRGSRHQDGCQFTESGSGVASGEPVLEVRDEVEYDAATCTRSYTKVVYTATAGPQWAKDVLTSATGNSATVALAASTAKTYKGALYATLKDPIGLRVSETDAILEWNATTSTVKSYSGSGKWSWLGATGWTKTGGSVTQGRTNSSTAWVNTTGTFSNATFCKVITGGLGGTTYANHAKTRFVGKKGGGYDWSATINKSGGCNGLLHVKTYLIKP